MSDVLDLLHLHLAVARALVARISESLYRHSLA